MWNKLIQQFDWAKYGKEAPFLYDMNISTSRHKNNEVDENLAKEEEILKIRSEALDTAMYNASKTWETTEEVDAAAKALDEAQAKYLE